MGRNREIKIRLSDDEHSALMKKRGAMRLAAWMRQSCLSNIPPQIPSINRDALIELGRIGSNINQIARALNTGDRAVIGDLQQQIGQLRIALIEASPSPSQP